MVYILLNFLPIAFAAALGLAFGAIWLRFEKRPVPRASVIAWIALAQFWSASILAGALILAPPEAGEWTMAIGSALVIWAGFVLPVLASSLAVGKVEGSRIVSASGYWLVTMAGQAALMKAWGLSAPPSV